MLTWILIAIIVAALFGVINLDNIRQWIIAKSKEAWPYIKKAIDTGKQKIEETKNKDKNN